jgi:hypothetical protein
MDKRPVSSPLLQMKIDRIFRTGNKGSQESANRVQY